MTVTGYNRKVLGSDVKVETCHNAACLFCSCSHNGCADAFYQLGGVQTDRCGLAFKGYRLRIVFTRLSLEGEVTVLVS